MTLMMTPIQESGAGTGELRGSQIEQRRSGLVAFKGRNLALDAEVLQEHNVPMTAH